MKIKFAKLLACLAFAILLFKPINLFGQAKECSADFSQMVEKVKTDYSGYADKTRGKEKKFAALNARTAEILAGKSVTVAGCSKILLQWVAYFKDYHLQLDTKSNENPPEHDFRVTTGSLEPSFKTLDANTILIKIPSFELNYKSAIDELLKAHQQEIIATKNLLIDLRGNGGGGDSAYEGLIPLIYTKPIKIVGVDFWASTGNIAFYQGLVNNPTFPEEPKATLRNMITKMESSLGQFVMIDEAGDSDLTMEKVSSLPQKVAVLIDNHNASTTEQFLLAAKQSSKVTLFGKSNTLGCLDYSNLTDMELQSGKRIFEVPSSRSRRLPKNPVDGIGIAPNVRIPRGEKDEIKYVQIYLNH